ncbi:DUF5713 family protein [Nonomuraea terrae]|uniref:DUF5713 family protein n=1 Tax=Nonomuraea terrae TaxID=2530383 RepID=UPI0037BAF720
MQDAVIPYGEDRRRPMALTNRQVAGHPFLQGMYDDGWFPGHLVDKGRAILLRLCARIEAERPAGLTALYALTDAATEEFLAADSEIETVARELIAADFAFVAAAYGFPDADTETLIGARDW